MNVRSFAPLSLQTAKQNRLKLQVATCLTHASRMPASVDRRLPGYEERQLWVPSWSAAYDWQHTLDMRALGCTDVAFLVKTHHF